MAKRTPPPTAYAQVRVNLWLNVPVGTLSLEDALVKARTLKSDHILELVDSDTDVNDVEVEVVGVYK